MTQAEAAAGRGASELPLRGVICPHLGLRGDRSTAAHRVDREHVCYHPQRPAPIHPEIQATFCLAGRYPRCPVYRGVVERPATPARRLPSLGGTGRMPGRLVTTLVFVVAIPALLGGLLALAVDDDVVPTVPTRATQPGSSDLLTTDPGQGTAGGLEVVNTSTGQDVTAEPDVPPSRVGDPLVRLRNWPSVISVDVMVGNSLPGIATEFGTTVEAILLLNGLAVGDQIDEGQVLLVPLGFRDPLTAAEVALGLNPAEGSEAAPAGGEALDAAELLAEWPDLFDVVVQEGDTPGLYAGLYGTTAEAVIAYNGLADAESLFVGTTVTIPVGFSEPLGGDATVVAGGGGEAEAESPDGVGAPIDDDALAALLAWDEITVWTVQSGDSLVAIAEEFTTTVEAIAQYNGISAAEPILIGQALDVPVGFQLSLTAPEGEEQADGGEAEG